MIARQIQADALLTRPARSLRHALAATREPLLFGLRLWASVCLATFIAFWLQLDNPYWAGTSAAVVCQPQLGAALRKGWFRMIGTVIGAVAIVVFTACFPQDRIGFLGLLALWSGVCAFVATVLRNFASYAASLAGYTAVIIAADVLGATGGPSSEVFLLAIYRASEICIGIVCAGVVLALTDPGGAQRRLSESLSDLAEDIMGGFTRMLATNGPRPPDTQAERSELLRRVIALDPMIDLALGESSYLRNRSAMLLAAVRGLLAALVGWRGVASQLNRLPDDRAWAEAEAVLVGIPAELRQEWNIGSRGRWMGDATTMRRACADGERVLLAQTADTPSRRLLIDETAKLLNGMGYVLNELALLAESPGRTTSAGHCDLSPGVADWLPAFINGARAFVTIAAVELFWVATAWPNGGTAIVFATIVMLLMSPRGDLAYEAALAFALTAAVGIVIAAILEFAVLPAIATFPAFCAVIGVVLIPIGFVAAWSGGPALAAVLGGMAVAIFRLLAPTNPMTYDTSAFYNTALGIFVACAIGPLAFRLLPPLSPMLRTRRLLALTLRDLRGLAAGMPRRRPKKWERRMYDRLAALPDQAEPRRRSELLAAFSVGADIEQLRHLVARHGLTNELNDALAFLAEGNTTAAITRLHQIDDRLDTVTDPGPKTGDALRVRGRIAAIAETLTEHAAYFGSRAFA